MDQRQAFRDLHKTPFIIPNPWDVGSARILASLGFPALATTSAEFANALGRHDGDVSREETIAHARLIDGATTLPVNADLENGFGQDPAAAAETISQALEAGIAGSAISMAAQSAIVEAAKELLETGTHAFWLNALPNAALVNDALSPNPESA